MSTELMARLIIAAGIGQLGILVAAALVPHRLRWRDTLAQLPRLHRQMYCVYGCYIALSILAFALLSLSNARELAGGSALARGLCGYIAVFWGLRLVLQAVFDVRAYLTTWWLTAGYHLLTVLFAGLTIVYALAALAG